MSNLAQVFQSAMELERKTWNKALEAAARIVRPYPHREEERTCAKVARDILSLRDLKPIKRLRKRRKAVRKSRRPA